VAAAAVQSHPERAAYRRRLEGISSGPMSAYESAADCLRKMRPILKGLGRDAEWTKLLADIRQNHKNRPRFMEILDKLERRPIVSRIESDAAADIESHWENVYGPQHPLIGVERHSSSEDAATDETPMNTDWNGSKIRVHRCCICGSLTVFHHQERTRTPRSNTNATSSPAAAAALARQLSNGLPRN
jgi:hypothetical protein